MSSTDQNLIGHRILQLDSVDSTNNYVAKILSTEDIPHGSVIMAVEQTAGRGQRGSIWISNPGENLLLTILLRPANLSVSDQFRLTQFASLALLDLLEGYGISSSIKWPNDLLVNDHKIAGMLIENQVTSNRITNVLLGIGLNVNQTNFNELCATSIYTVTRVKYTLMDVAFSLFSALNKYWKLLQDRSFSVLDDKYQRMLYKRNVSTYFYDHQGVFEGTIVGTTDQGLLTIMGRNDELRSYDLKEVKFNRRNDL
jgi:BirA family biotin operon repressor/biotin-[acetyl-CoA-carboxylase] ligase